MIVLTAQNKLLKVLLQALGHIPDNVMEDVAFRLSRVFKSLTFDISQKHIDVPTHAFNEGRRQYNSSIILEELSHLYNKGVFEGYERVIGLVDVDAYVLGLNFVFGEALLNGPVAIVYLARLKPEFYGGPSNYELFIERICKEIVHELGHTIGLRHCANPRCVMHFSNSIIDTDYKSMLFCARCQSIISRILTLFV